MTTEQLRKLWEMVWMFRAEVQDAFPTPGRDDSLAFAYTESAREAISAAHGWPDELDAAMVFSGGLLEAQLRQNPRYKRNNPDKSHSIERELTQCAMMLLTAVPCTWHGWSQLDIYGAGMIWTPCNIAIRVGKCLEVPSDYAYILQTVVAINTAVNLDETLPAELDRMRAKHGLGGHGGAIANVYPVKSERLVLADYADGAGVNL
jgi:hypothetical protein